MQSPCFEYNLKFNQINYNGRIEYTLSHLTTPLINYFDLTLLIAQQGPFNLVKQ